VDLSSLPPLIRANLFVDYSRETSVLFALFRTAIAMKYSQPWLLVAVVLAGCSAENNPQAEDAMPPPQQVTAIALAPRDLPARFEYVGRLAASREIEIRPRVSGLIEQRLFEEGSQVEAGAVLFRIDAAPFAAGKREASARLAEARASLAQAQREVKRLAPLAEKKTISQRDLDDARSSRDRARAEVEAAEAEVAQAGLELGYTDVVAPIAGRMGRALEVEGALVSQTSGPLTRMAQTDPLYVQFSISQNERLAMDSQRAAGHLVMPAADAIQVEVLLADDTPYAHTGLVDFTDYRTDANTGAFAMRATLPNPDSLLSPGQFVRVRILGGVLPGALAVPQRALLEDTNGKFVYVAEAGENGMTVANSRPVEVGEWLETDGPEGIEKLWLIANGLAAGDRVIVDGTARIFYPGMPVSTAASEPAVNAAPAGGP